MAGASCSAALLCWGPPQARLSLSGSRVGARAVCMHVATFRLRGTAQLCTPRLCLTRHACCMWLGTQCFLRVSVARLWPPMSATSKSWQVPKGKDHNGEVTLKQMRSEMAATIIMGTRLWNHC
jgi:hypothetical protein